MATNGQVVLAKVNVDDNPATSQAFRVQGIPAVFALVEGKVVDTFVGAQGADFVNDFVQKLVGPVEPTEIDLLREAGDEASLRHALTLEPDNADVITDLAELYAGEDRGEEALELLAKIPETPETRRIAAYVRSAGKYVTDEAIENRLGELLPTVKGNDEARLEFLDLLELLGSEDPRSQQWRKQLTNYLF